MIEELLTKAKTEGYRTVHQSDTELLFCKENGPLMNGNPYFAGATLFSGMVREIIGDALQRGAVVRWAEKWSGAMNETKANRARDALGIIETDEVDALIAQMRAIRYSPLPSPHPTSKRAEKRAIKAKRMKARRKR